MTRLVGGAILGYATLMWFGRRTDSIEARRAIALALFVQDAIGFAASLKLQLGGSINDLGWSNPILYGILAFACLLLLHPGERLLAIVISMI